LQTITLVSAFLCAHTLCACGEDPATDPACAPVLSPISLIDQTQWVYQTSADEDPLADHRPDPIECPEFAYEVESGILEVDTGACNYLSVTQPTLVSVQACDTVQATVSHFDLYSPQAAEAHVSVLLDGDPILDETVSIPGPANFFYVRVPADREYERGVPVTFHIHNHGANQWQIVDLSVGSD